MADVVGSPSISKYKDLFENHQLPILPEMASASTNWLSVLFRIKC